MDAATGIGIHGKLFEVTVVRCSNLNNSKWFSKQHSFVCLDYGSFKYRTRTCTGGGISPMFQDKFVFTLIERLTELDIAVWRNKTFTNDTLIGRGKIQLQKVLSQGYDESSWPIQTETGRAAGLIQLILQFSNANASAASYPPPGSAALYRPPAPAAPHPPPAPAYPYRPPHPPSQLTFDLKLILLFCSFPCHN